jgi:predicted DsbA family dithiol-disulfide isomerase
VIRWALAEGVQDAVVERLFQLYFIEGANLTDKKVLADAAVEAGIDRAVVEHLLAGETDKAETQAEIAKIQHMGVTGVPAFIVGNRYAVMGAREPEVIAQAIQEVARERRLPARQRLRSVARRPSALRFSQFHERLHQLPGAIEPVFRRIPRPDDDQLHVRPDLRP